jgi:general secretion pathway protein L
LANLGAWWLERMRELMTPSGQATALPDGLRLRAADAEATRFEVSRRRRGRIVGLEAISGEADLARVRALRRRGETLTLVADRTLLRRTAVFPLASERGLATLLRYEMDRLTPFAAADLVWDWRLLRRDRARGTLEVELLLLPRAALADGLERLEEAGLKPDAIEARLPDGTDRSLGLLAPDPLLARQSRQRVVAGLAVCSGLALACIATPFIRQALAARELEADIAALRPRVAEAQALQRRLSGANDGADALTLGRVQAADLLTVLAALTDVLPDDTSLTMLAVRQRRVTLEGQTSAAATRLIAAFAAEPHLRAPAFTAPVVRGDNGNEIFALQAELAR